MADSKFLKYQDKNNDGLIDVCEDIETVPTNNCPACKRDPNAIVPKWKKRATYEPWFNAKYCTYQCTVVTQETSLMRDPSILDEENNQFINELFENNASIAVDSLLDYFNKVDSGEVRSRLIEAIDYTKYDLNPLPGSTVKLLYTIPYDMFATLEQKESPDDESIDNSEEGDVTAQYMAEEINVKLLTMRKAMHMFSRYYRVYNAIEGGVFKFVDSGKVFTTAQFERYGDAGFFIGNSRMKDLLSDLDEWMNSRGFNIFGSGTPSFSRDRATKIEFTTSKEYRLKTLKIWTVGCGDKPTVFKDGRLSGLNLKDSWSDSTAVGYFMKLDDIENYVSARIERPWIEFVEEFTYPKVTPVFNYPSSEEMADDDYVDSVASCVGEALRNEGKQLGQDLVDGVFGIGDAIAYVFHKNVCYSSGEQLAADRENLGLVFRQDPSAKSAEKRQIDPWKTRDAIPQRSSNKESNKSKNISGLAIQQAFREMHDDDQIFVQMCARVLQGSVPVTSSEDFMKDFHKFGLGQIKICGLLDLMVDSIQCLFKGLSLEDALGSATKAALRAMSIENYGKLFADLPPDKQDEIEQLVRRKLADQDMFSTGTGAQRLSDAVESNSTAYANDDIPLFGKITLRPWQDAKIIESEKQNAKETNYGPPAGAQGQLSVSADRDRRTLAQQFDPGTVGQTAKEQLDPNKVMEAHVLAMVEVYAEDPLELVDLLNRFPGAQIIAKIISLMDCPRAPLFDPNFMDFIKSVELPFCRNTSEIALPRIENPLAWLPEAYDWPKMLFEALVSAIYAVIINIIKVLLKKVCEIIGDAICKALERHGDLSASMPDIITGRQEFKDIIRQSICGTDADEDQINNTIAEMFEKLGVGGAALADQEAVNNFTGDISNATTRREMLQAFCGEPSDNFLDITTTIVNNQYPQFSDGLGNAQDMADFFKNCGNLFPTPFRGAVRDMLDALPDVDDLPANPSLCATPEDLENFKNRRCTLLSGRATPEQCEIMFQNLQDEMLEDLDDLNQVLNNGVPRMLENALPPLISTPGCDDGLIPYESQESINTAAQTLAQSMEQLKIDFSQDMIGNGPGKNNWGMLNLILSDTEGMPLSAHMRRTFNRRRNVDFVTQVENDGFSPGPPDVRVQRGQFPGYVAEWLQSQMSSLEPSFESNNNWRPRKIYKRSFKELGINDLFGGISLTSLPDFGYNVKVEPDFEEEMIVISREGRKNNADISLFFEDNNQGKKSLGEIDHYQYAFNLNLFLSDMEAVKNNQNNEVIVNKFSDNARISIVNHFKLTPSLSPTYRTMTREQKKKAREALREAAKEEVATIKERKYEFLSVDNTLEDIEIENYPQFSLINKIKYNYLPQIIMLSDIISEEPSTIKSTYDSVMSDLYGQMLSDVAGGIDSFGGPEKPAWQFGAQFDDLNADDLDYVVRDGQTLSSGGTEYGDAEVQDYNSDGDPDGTRGIENDDMILGISRMQYEENQGSSRKNRVFYLDPGTYGGNYINPPVYIKPLENKAWLGFVDVMFPELSPCKPSRTDIVDFQDLSKEISKAYENMPEDQRLKSDPDCIVEMPYNRVLERYSKAGIQGILKAACRIYSSTHFIKSMATFTTFAPKFTQTYSSLYAAYVVENMEESMKDAQTAGWEAFNTFKDEEFWYAFLEQSVQTYARLVDDGTITDPPESVLHALFRINDAQERYKYPYKQDLKDARETGAAGQLQSLKSWRYEKNLDAVRASEEDAKLVLKEMVIQELNHMGEKFMKNLEVVDMQPTYHDMEYYFMSQLCAGGETLDLDKEIVETTTGLPTVPYAENEEADGPYYTSGGILSAPDGEDYVGYYHVHQDEDGNITYMEGEEHSSQPHAELTVYADKIIVPIGDVGALGSVSPGTKAFMLEKYISIDGTKYAPNEAIDIIKQNSADLNISDVYPGDLELVYAPEVTKTLYGEAQPVKTINRYEYTDPDSAPVIGSGFPEGSSPTRVVGIKGNLGVRHGLKLSMMLDGVAKEITTVEIDALDLKIPQMQTLDGDSKLLYCLIRNLKDDEKFKLLANYIFPLPKITATIAIYNDMGFLPSIGQVTVEEVGIFEANDDAAAKPGMRITVDDDTGEVIAYEATPGWEHVDDRPNITPFIRTWDEWDQVLLRNTKSRLKRSFKRFYNLRDFKPGDDDSAADASKTVINDLKGAMKLPPAGGLLPWWKRSRLRTNPFDSKGKLCEKN